MRCWGRATEGQLGPPYVAPTRNQLSPVSATVMGAAQPSTGLRHTCAVTSDRRVLCWGRNEFGEIGDGTSGDSRTPRGVSFRAGEVPVEIALGEQSTCARLMNQEVRCWGRNGENALGDGTTTNSYVPNPVLNERSTAASRLPLTGVERIFSGPIQGAVALLTSGAVAQWGGYVFGGGRRNTYATVRSGEVFCSGSNEYGAIGNGVFYTTPSQTEPQALLPTLLSALRVDSGARRYTQVVVAVTQNACALATDGTVDCWGYAGRGFLNPTGLDHLVRVPSTPAMVSLYP